MPFGSARGSWPCIMAEARDERQKKAPCSGLTSPPYADSRSACIYRSYNLHMCTAGRQERVPYSSLCIAAVRPSTLCLHQNLIPIQTTLQLMFTPSCIND